MLHVETASASCIKSVFYIWKIYGEAGKTFSTIYCLFRPVPIQGQSYDMDRILPLISFDDLSLWDIPICTLGVGGVNHIIVSSKSSHQDLSNDGSNEIEFTTSLFFSCSKRVGFF